MTTGPAFLQGGGETSALLRTGPWICPTGLPDPWPPTLRTTLQPSRDGSA